MSALLPEGVDSLADCPHTLFDAIRVALRILSYHEWPPEDRPPKRIWMDGPRLEEHWARVDADRARRYGAPKDAGEFEENAVELIKRG